MPIMKFKSYNTADNVPNVVWIDDHGDVFPLKSKFELNRECFIIQVQQQMILLNCLIISNSTDDLPTPDPTAAGQTLTEDENGILEHL